MPSFEVDIRPVREDEVDDIVDIYNTMWVGSRAPLDKKMGRSFYRGITQNPTHEMYAVVVSGRPVGAFVLLVEGERTVMENVAVHPQYQKQGVGERIVDFAVAKCRETGCRTLEYVSSDRREKEHGFYEHMQFERQGNRFIRQIGEE